MKTNTYGTPEIGCYLDQGNYNRDELSLSIVELAQSLGWQVNADGLATLKQYAGADSERSDGPDYDLSETLDYLSEEAIDWLNEQETRSFLYWANKGEAGAFGLWINVEGAKEDCEFVSSKSQEFPESDFEGEWLHVSDHGNATLYARSKGKDSELWSIV